jgi:nitroreductase/NAD-dependent dihydropyrimidine dehydrogenase PreA subunit
MSLITVDKERCVKDGVCIAVCGSLTLRTNDEGYPEETPGRMCIQCGHCVAACACDALTHSGLPQEKLLPVAKTLPEPALLDSFLNSRRSVREFKEQPVPRETMEALLDVARRAPTAGNQQKLHWIVVSGMAKIHALSEEAINWVRAAQDPLGVVALWDDKGYDFVLRAAPTVVVVCTPADWEWGKEDGAIALTFLELAAEARGLGVCWAGFLGRVAAAHAPMRRLLQIPEGYVMQGGLMLGEPKYKYQYVPPRKPLSAQWL